MPFSSSTSGALVRVSALSSSAAKSLPAPRPQRHSSASSSSSFHRHSTSSTSSSRGATTPQTTPHRQSTRQGKGRQSYPPTPKRTALQRASEQQAALDADRQAVDQRLARDPALSPVVASAIKALLQSLLRDREHTRLAIKGLLVDGPDNGARLADLRGAQASQARLLRHCADALDLAPVVAQVEAYARDLGQQYATCYGLDLGGAASWVRVKTTHTKCVLPETSPLLGCFDGCALEVTRQVRLADLRGTAGAGLYNLFQPLTATILDAAWGAQGRDLDVVVELGPPPEDVRRGRVSQGGGNGDGGGGFVQVQCYGYTTPVQDGGKKMWACTLPGPCQLASRRHLLGLSVPVPQVPLAPGQRGLLEVVVSVA